MKTNKLLKPLVLFLFLIDSIFAVGGDAISIPHNSGEINFDGIPDEAFWQSAQTFNLETFSPNYKAIPTENSTIYISYDDEYLWIGAMLDYRDPANIVSTSKKRDEKSKNPDSFGILLDTYNDNENALAFFTMPAGQRIDYAVSNDAKLVSSKYGNTAMNYSWNTFWDVKTARTKTGWAVEMKIPFSSLRFQVIDDKVEMGLIINRSVSYCNEINTFPSTDPKYGKLASNKPSLAQTIELVGIKNSKPVYISPYATTGFQKQNELNDDETALDYSEDKKLTGGLDVKYSLTSNLTMDVTFNTDFGQVEADDEKVNLTRYALYYPEKRMFFQERSSIFDYNLGSGGKLFYSRRVGIDDDGNFVPIWGGARLTGRAGKWDVGFMDMQTQKEDEVASENFGVFRLRRQVINSNSYVGAIMTSRMGFDSDNSYAYGVDGIFRLFGDDYLQVNLAQTTDTLGNNFDSDQDNILYSVTLERRNDVGLGYDFTYRHAGEVFEPTVGFMTRCAVNTTYTKLQYGWLPGKDSKLFNFGLEAMSFMTHRVTDNKIETGMFGPGFSLMTKTGWYGKFDFFYNIQGVDEEFELDDNVIVPVDEYRYFGTRMNFKTPVSKPLSAEFNLSGGEFYDGNNFTISSEPIYNLSASLQFSGYYNYSYVFFPNRNQTMNAHVGRLKFLYMYNTKLSFSSFVQYNSVSDVMVSNFRLRYNPREGNDLYLVYNEMRPTSDYFNDGLEKVDILDRMIQIKYVHTFQL